MGSHSVTCHPTEVILTPLPRRIADIDPEGMKGWVDLGGWLYQDGLPAHRRSPIQVLTGPDVE